MAIDECMYSIYKIMKTKNNKKGGIPPPNFKFLMVC